MIKLPVSGWQVDLPALTGFHESVFLDTRYLSEAQSLVAIFPQLVESESPRNWADLPVSDADALLLTIRRSAFGDTLQADAYCPSTDCRARVDIAFQIGDYLRHHTPTPDKKSTREDTTWWNREGVRFRVPTLGDEIEASGAKNPAQHLMSLCIDGQPNAKSVSKVSAALDHIAPNLSGELTATCPDCENAISFAFDPRAFVLKEIRGLASYLDEDVHLLASAYHWSYAEILSLPRVRRSQFAERIRIDLRGGEA